MDSNNSNHQVAHIAKTVSPQPEAPGNNLRIKIFYRLLPSISAYFRRRRMAHFLRIMKPKPGTRVLDLGGAPPIWEHIDVPLQITLLNLGGIVENSEFKSLAGPRLKHHSFEILEGDACNVKQFGDHSFDLVFSNSVIEHVGPPDRQADFAREVRRLGKAYWVQTPSKWFPIEAHSGLLFYWFYPKWLHGAIFESWRRRLPSWWIDYIGSTRVLSRRRLAELFPGATTHVEFFLGFPKSYVRYRIAAR